MDLSTYKLERQFFRTGRRITPKFCTHVRIETRTALTKKNWTHPNPGGFRGLSMCVCVAEMWFCGMCVAFSTRPSDRTQIWHACADRHSHLKKKNLTHPTPGGLRGLSIVKNLSRWTAPKFGTHVRIDTLTLKKIKQI